MGPAGQAPPFSLAEQPTAVIPRVANPPTKRYEPQVPPEPAPRELDREPEPEPDMYRRPRAQYEPQDEPYAGDRGYRPAEESPLEYQRSRDRRSDRTNLIANTIGIVTALIALVFILHIVFTLFGANENSGFVAFDYSVAKVFVLGFGDVFTPKDAKIGLVLNYALAAVVYLVVGRILYRTLRRG